MAAFFVKKWHRATTGDPTTAEIYGSKEDYTRCGHALLSLSKGIGPAEGLIHLQAGALTASIARDIVLHPMVVAKRPGDLQLRLGMVEVNMDDPDFLGALQEAAFFVLGLATGPARPNKTEAA